MAVTFAEQTVLSECLAPEIEKIKGSQLEEGGKLLKWTKMLIFHYFPYNFFTFSCFLICCLFPNEEKNVISLKDLKKKKKEKGSLH